MLLGIKQLLLALCIALLFPFFSFVTATTSFAQSLGPCADDPTQLCIYDAELDQDNVVIGEGTSTIRFDDRGIRQVQDTQRALEAKVQLGETSVQAYTQEANDALLSILYLKIMGGEPLPSYRVISESGIEKQEYSSGLVGSMGKTIAYFYGNPPASTEQYLAYVFNSAGIQIAQPAYAQVGGFGFSSLTPILSTWITFRNLAYIFFVIIFIVIGFLIMFRQKINGQTAVTIQQALPQIIISLLAVTFSFAIAGLLIDAMYIFMYMLIAVFGSPDKADFYMAGSIFEIGVDLIFGGDGGFVAAQNLTETFVTNIFDGHGWLAEGIGWFIGKGGGFVAGVIFAIVLAIGIFRLFFELLKTYISILISIVTAPISLMMGAIPGKGGYFTAWVKGLVGNLAAFPAVLFLLLLYYSLIHSDLTAENGASGFVPPYLIGGGQGDAIKGMIGLGIIFILPTFVVEAKKAFGASGGIFDQFSAAVRDAAKTGMSGSEELIPGVGWSKVPGAPAIGRQVIQKPLFGTKESRERNADGKFNVFGRGFLGAPYEDKIQPRVQTGIDKFMRRKQQQNKTKKESTKPTGPSQKPVREM